MRESSPPEASAWSSSPTALLLGVYVVAHVAMMLTGGRAEIASASSETLMKFGASYAPLVREGQLHRLVASMFLHIGLLHLCLNSAALVSIGPTLERDYGRLRFVAIYLASGLVGSVASVLWHLENPVVSAGASGALCGAIAAGAVRAHLAGRERAGERRMLVSWAIATLAFGVLVQADNAAHLGGLASGALFGFLARRGAPRREPTQGPAALVLAVVLLAFGGSVLARERSETAPSLVNRGVELAQGGDLDRAISAYRRALQLEPRDAIAHYDLGLALQRKEDWEGAIFHLSRALELEPDEQHRRALVGAHVNHGVSLSERGDVSGAIAAYRRALELDDQNANAHRNLGLALEKSGDRPGSISALRRAVELAPNPEMKGTLASLLTNDALDLAAAKQHIQAVARYRESISLDPTEWRTHFNLGLSLLELGDAQGAVSALEQAQELEDSEVVRALLSRAIEARRDARADAGDLSGALDDLGRATLMRLQSPRDAGD
ncbi:MAG: tetratricopeptide repeat protein [Myxococcales bacterium]|nr:tetratricopeptide repeat protein [Myxococcales bacterium]